MKNKNNSQRTKPSECKTFAGSKTKDNTDSAEVTEPNQSLMKDKTADILKDLKDLLRSHKGRSTINEFEIRDIINKYGEEDEN